MNIKNVKIITLILDDDLNQNGVKAGLNFDAIKSLRLFVPQLQYVALVAQSPYDD